MSTFTPTPEEMQNKNEPGKPMGQSVPDNLASGISPASMAQLTQLLADYQSKLDVWQAADKEVHKQIDLVMSGAELLNTIATTLIPAITGLIKGVGGAGGLSGTSAPSGGIGGSLTGLLNMVQQITSIKNTVQGLLPGLKIPGL